MIATAAFAVFLMSAFNLCAEEAAKASTGDANAVDSSVAAVADPACIAASGPDGGSDAVFGRPNIGTPKVELFLGYSYLRAVPKLAAGNRLVWLNGGSASIAFNLNRYLGLVGDFGAYTNSQMRFHGRIYVHSRREQCKRGCPHLSLRSALFLPEARQGHSLCPGSVWRHARQ